MINEQQQELASLYAVGALSAEGRAQFEAEFRGDKELHEFVRGLQRAAGLLAVAVPPVSPPARLREKILERIGAATAPASKPAPPPALVAGLRFLNAGDPTGWKQLPVPGAYIKLLSLEHERGYAVLMGKLDAGARYPAHVNAGPEDFYVLTGDLHIGDRKLVAGDFHHADGGSQHDVNYSVEGCTLLAVLTTDDPLVAFAMA